MYTDYNMLSVSLVCSLIIALILCIIYFIFRRSDYIKEQRNITEQKNIKDSKLGEPLLII